MRNSDDNNSYVSMISNEQTHSIKINVNVDGRGRGDEMQFIKKQILLLKVFLAATVLLAISTNAEIDTNNPFAREILQRSKAADMKTWMDSTIDPCEDFYNFACGRWRRINSAKNAKMVSTDTFQAMAHGLQKKVEKLMTQAKTGDAIEDKLRDFYESCKQTKSKLQQYRLALQKLYKEYGEFSFVKSGNGHRRTDFNWWSTIAEIHKTYGKSIIFSLDVQGDVKNKSHTMLYVGPPEFSLIRSRGDVPQYLQEHFGVNNKQALRVTDTLIDFEWKLVRGASGSTVEIEELLTLYQTKDLMEKYKDFLDFDRFLKLALNTTQLPQQIYVYDEAYLQNLIDVFAVTDTRTVQDYILWLLLEEYVIDADTPLWNTWCGEKTKKYFGKFIDHTIYGKYRSVEYEKEVFQLWHEIKAIFRADLEGDKHLWMSNDTRLEAIKKLDNMNLTINSYDQENFLEFFRNLQIDPHNYVANIQNILKRAESMRENKLVANTEGIADTEVLSFTPVYNTFENAIKIPVALLLPFRVWHPVYPRAIKYATLGFLLAHEMIHGFDDEGRHYDSQGHTNNWWDAKCVQEFEQRRTCFQNQYHSYIYDGTPLPSSVSQSENIADNAAIKLAFAAYSHWLQSEKGQQANIESREGLVNLSYNNWETFFLSFSQLWCDDVHENYKTALVMQDIHAPAMYRVIGSLSNFPKFAEVFKCRNGSVMNPTKKCAIY